MSKELDYYESEKTLPKKSKKQRGKFGIKLHMSGWNDRVWIYKKFYKTEKARNQAYENHKDHKLLGKPFYSKIEKIER